MEPGELAGNYLRYIGAGAVAAGGIISMFRALPLIIGSIVVGPARPAGDPRAAGGTRRRPADRARHADDGRAVRQPRRWCSSSPLVPQLGLGLSFQGLLGAVDDPAVRLPVRHRVAAG